MQSEGLSEDEQCHEEPRLAGSARHVYRHHEPQDAPQCHERDQGQRDAHRPLEQELHGGPSRHSGRTRKLRRLPMSDELILRQASPTLAGLKTGSLFTVPYRTEAELRADIAEMNRRLAPKGVYLRVLRVRRRRAAISLPPEAISAAISLRPRRPCSSGSSRCSREPERKVPIMSKIAVIYWSGTGNTEAMAKAVAQGARGKGASAELLTETLEEDEFEPMFQSIKSGR